MRSPDVVEYHHDGSRRTKSRAMKIFRVESTCSDYPHKKGSAYTFSQRTRLTENLAWSGHQRWNPQYFPTGSSRSVASFLLRHPKMLNIEFTSVLGHWKRIICLRVHHAQRAPSKCVWNSRKTVSSSTNASLGLLRRNLKLHLRHKEKSLKDVRFFSFPLQTSTLRFRAQPHLICASEHASVTEPPPSTRHLYHGKEGCRVPFHCCPLHG